MSLNQTSPPPRPWRTLVVGGCGFFGQHLVRALLSQPSTYTSITILDLHTPTHSRIPGGTYHSCDITSTTLVKSLFTEIQPQLIFHCASPKANIKSLSLHLHVNVEGTKNLLQQAKTVGSVRAFVFTSSASVVHDTVSDLFDADEGSEVLYLPVQREVYGHSKAIAEGAVLEANEPEKDFLTVAIRPSSVFGEGDMIHSAKVLNVGMEGKARMQMGNGKNLFDYTYVGNLVDAHLLAAEKLMERDGERGKVDGEAFFVTNDEHMQFWGFVRRMASAAGFPVAEERIVVIPRWAGLVMGWLAEWGTWAMSLGRRESNLTVTGVRYSTLTRTYDISKAKERLGYRPRVSMEEGIRRTADWYLNEVIGKKTL